MISIFIKLGVFGVFAFLVSIYLGTEMLNLYVITNTLWAAIDLTYMCAGRAIIRDFNVALNSNDVATANRNANRILWFTLFIGAVLTIAGMIATTQITDILGIQPEYQAVATEYIFWLMPTMFIVETVFLAGYILTADSNFKLLFIMDVLVFSTGVLLAILFLGVMDMGIMGVLWASIISNLVWGLLFVIHLMSKKYNFKLSFEFPTKETLKSIWSFFMIFGFDILSFAIIITIINKSLIANFPIEIASIFIVIYSIYSYVLKPLGMGIVNVGQPLISAFHDEQNITGIKDTFGISIKWALKISVTFVIASLVATLFLNLDYGDYSNSAMHIMRLFLVFAPFLVLGDIIGDTLVIIKKNTLAFIFALFYNILIPLTILFFIINSGDSEDVWMLLGIEGLLAIVIITLFIKLKYKKLNFESLLGKNSSLQQFCFLIKSDAANDIAKHQEKVELFLIQNKCDNKKIERCKIAISGLFDHSQESNQRKNSFIDVRILILENGDLGIRTKFENKLSAQDIDSADEKWLSLNLLKNNTKEFSYKQLTSFNVMDIVI
ncbi:MAG: hypothetical protein R3Y22_01875 [Bacteroidales bacterium]